MDTTELATMVNSSWPFQLGNRPVPLEYTYCYTYCTHNVSYSTVEFCGVEILHGEAS